MEVDKFKAIFSGLDIAYGQHQSNGERADGKQEGKSYIVRKEITDELWEKHLEGVGPSLGIIPIKADNTVVWGCIDIDTYPLDHKNLIHKIRKLNIPLIHCKSKSGGAHLFLFTARPIAAKIMRSKLRSVASDLGYSSAEIFPKQSSILIEKGDLGNFLNLPYYNYKNTSRCAVNDDGTNATYQEFLELYNKHVVNDIDKIASQSSDKGISDGPPCLQSLCSQGFPEGTRNNGLFNIGVYLRKFDPENWKTLIEEYNRKYMTPPLPSSEVVTIIKQLEKKDYAYRCKEQPIASFCNASVCKTRKFGIGADNVAPQFGSLSKLCTEPPIWFLDVEDQRLELSTEELQMQQKFQRRCMDVLNFPFPLVKSHTWQETLRNLMSNVIEIEVSSDGSVAGQFEVHLQEFCTDRAQALNKDELLLHKPWTEDGRTYFRLKDLHDYLIRNKFTHYNTGQIVARLRDLKGVSKFFKIKGRGVNTWCIPAFQQQDSDFDIKEMESAPF